MKWLPEGLLWTRTRVYDGRRQESRAELDGSGTEIDTNLVGSNAPAKAHGLRAHDGALLAHLPELIA
jgi:hypothetical protein